MPGLSGQDGYSPGRTVKTNLCLKLFDLLTDSGLADLENFGGEPLRSRAQDFPENLQLPKLYARGGFTDHFLNLVLLVRRHPNPLDARRHLPVAPARAISCAYQNYLHLID